MAEREIDRRSFEWPLTTESLVVEVGGFKGRWASEIARRYQCRVQLFEPQRWAADLAGEAFRGSGARWEVHHYGLSTAEDAGEREMGAWGTDGCSLLKGAEYMETYEGSRDKLGIGRFRDALPVLAELGEIDLLMMNIEGYEYRLLPYLIDGGAFDHIRYLAVQFHAAFEGDGHEFERLYRAIEQTHYDLGWGFGKPLITWGRR